MIEHLVRLLLAHLPSYHDAPEPDLEEPARGQRRFWKALRTRGVVVQAREKQVIHPSRLERYCRHRQHARYFLHRRRRRNEASKLSTGEGTSHFSE